MSEYQKFFLLLVFKTQNFQVCFKHPDLLKQAREACVAKKDEVNKLKRKNSSNMQITPQPAKIIPAPSAPKMCKIQFQDNESEEETDEEFVEDLNMQDTCSRMIPINSSKSSKSVKIRFQMTSTSDTSDLDDDDESEAEVDEMHKQLTQIFGDMSAAEETSQQGSERSSTLSSSENQSCSIQKSPTTKMMKIHYQDYRRRVLANEMKSIMHQNYLTDVQFVCHDGLVYGNSLILGSMSHFLYNMLAEVPIVDKVKIIIIPDISSADLNTLFKLLFNNSNETISLKDMQKIKNLAKIFKLEPILVMTRRPGRPKGSLNKPKTSSSSISSAAKKVFHENVQKTGMIVQKFSSNTLKSPPDLVCDDDDEDESNEFEEILETTTTINDKVNEQTLEYFDPTRIEASARTSSSKTTILVHHKDHGRLVMNSNLFKSTTNSDDTIISSLNQRNS